MAATDYYVNPETNAYLVDETGQYMTVGGSASCCCGGEPLDGCDCVSLAGRTLTVVIPDQGWGWGGWDCGSGALTCASSSTKVLDVDTLCALCGGKIQWLWRISGSVSPVDETCSIFTTACGTWGSFNSACVSGNFIMTVGVSSSAGVPGLDNATAAWTLSVPVSELVTGTYELTPLPDDPGCSPPDTCACSGSGTIGVATVTIE